MKVQHGPNPRFFSDVRACRGYPRCWLFSAIGAARARRSAGPSCFEPGPASSPFEKRYAAGRSVGHPASTLTKNARLVAKLIVGRITRLSTLRRLPEVANGATSQPTVIVIDDDPGMEKPRYRLDSVGRLSR